MHKLATLNELLHENLENHKELSKAKSYLISNQVNDDKKFIQRERKIEQLRRSRNKANWNDYEYGSHRSNHCNRNPLERGGVSRVFNINHRPKKNQNHFGAIDSSSVRCQESIFMAVSISDAINLSDQNNPNNITESNESVIPAINATAPSGSSEDFGSELPQLDLDSNNSPKGKSSIDSMDKNDGDFRKLSSSPPKESIADKSTLQEKDLVSTCPFDYPLRLEGSLPNMSDFEDVTKYFNPFMEELAESANTISNSQELSFIKNLSEFISEIAQRASLQYEHH